jgi:hypothetical protein
VSTKSTKVCFFTPTQQPHSSEDVVLNRFNCHSALRKHCAPHRIREQHVLIKVHKSNAHSTRNFFDCLQTSGEIRVFDWRAVADRVDELALDLPPRSFLHFTSDIAQLGITTARTSLRLRTHARTAVCPNAIAVDSYRTRRCLCCHVTRLRKCTSPKKLACASLHTPSPLAANPVQSENVI